MTLKMVITPLSKYQIVETKTFEKVKKRQIKSSIQKLKTLFILNLEKTLFMKQALKS